VAASEEAAVDTEEDAEDVVAVEEGSVEVTAMAEVVVAAVAVDTVAEAVVVAVAVDTVEEEVAAVDSVAAVEVTAMAEVADTEETEREDAEDMEEAEADTAAARTEVAVVGEATGEPGKTQAGIEGKLEDRLGSRFCLVFAIRKILLSCTL
jgi:hypothetical protein